MEKKSSRAELLSLDRAGLMGVSHPASFSKSLAQSDDRETSERNRNRRHPNHPH
jgi:hypothetical protein